MRKIIKYLMLSALVFGTLFPASAHINPKLSGIQTTNGGTSASLREDCSAGESLIDQSINNVRATLLLSGDVWWNGSDARYIVPKIDPASGLPEVSSIFAGAVWLGGFDGSNLKVACQQYGSSGGSVDFWPGPLTEVGTTSKDTCENWDRHFVVYGEEIDIHLSNYNSAVANDIDYDPDLIPDNVKYYPARGNQYFIEKYGFELPDAIQGLGAFWDEDGNALYEPEEGDYPIIEIRGCPEPQYPDEMIFWIYNDAGNVHGETGGAEIRMEVQVQAFGYKTNDELNNMTFQRYKLINRAVSVIDSCYFAMWVDPDMGCYTDDYIGCDTTRSLMYIYNADALDGETGCSCPGGVNTYCDEIPMLGVDYFRGPLGPKIFGPDSTLINPPLGSSASDTIVDLGMSSFTYYNNGGLNPEPGTDDPSIAVEFYNYLSGTWRDGLPFTFGDDGHTIGNTNVIKYAFPDPPNLLGGWSMAEAGLSDGDRRTVQASGPFRLDAGAVNELIVGVPWVPNVSHPSPSLSKLLFADDLAQSLFDNCFDITDGPDAPDVDWLELDRSVVALLTNDTDNALSNNVNEMYEENDLRYAGTNGDSLYVFEGYRIYQLASAASGSETDLTDPDHFRLIAQVDLKNGVTDLYNWTSVENPSYPIEGDVNIYIPNIQVENAPNNGIRHMFKIDEDQFATGDSRLINHKKYYYRVIAYAFNDWKTFDPFTGVGQRTPYLVGRRNIGDGVNTYYTVIPRPITDRVLNAEFGDQPAITRLDGIGAGENNLRISPETRQAILDGNFDGTIVYEPGAGPINISVYNPLNLKEADFELKLVDENLGNASLDAEVNWVLTEIDANGGVIATVASERTIEALNEQLITDYGFTVSIVQSDIPGQNIDDSNGAIGVDKVYANPDGEEWLSGRPDGPGVFNYIKTNSGEIDNSLDRNSALSTMGDGTWVPYTLCDWRTQPNQGAIITPAWFDPNSNIVRTGNGLKKLRNIDVVFTSDQSLWSRCVVVETATPFYTDCNSGLCLSTEKIDPNDLNEPSAKHFDLRKGNSVGKDGSPDGDGRGMGWFPGYAIDVETGQRLNIFFGENSVYSCDEPQVAAICEAGGFDSDPVGRDMIWNPTDQSFVITQGLPSMLNLYEGGQHMIYVTEKPYDECAELRTLFGSPDPIKKVTALRSVNWTSYSLLAPETKLLSNDVTVHIRVDNEYEVVEGTGVNDGYPDYLFSTRGMGASPLSSDDEINAALDQIGVVPNPYYGFSDYETGTFSNLIKITNLPAKCTVTIYSLEGKFIRQYKRNEQGASNSGENNRALEEAQFLPDIEWDLKNNASIPVASGVYLIHIDAGELGERVIKWFGVARQFDPAGL